MTVDGRLPLRDEQGQALVFVVLSLGVLVAAVALVVDVGSWFQAKRHAQSAADAAALAAAPQLLDNPGAVPGTVSSTADQNWSGVQVTQSQGANSVQVTAAPPAGSDLSPFGHFPISISASATAAIQVPAEVDAVAPIVVECSSCTSGPPGPWAANPWSDGSSVYVTYTPGAPDSNEFSPVQLQGVSTGNFDNFVTCSAADPSSSSCNHTSTTAPDNAQPLCLRYRFVGPRGNRRRVCSDANTVTNDLRSGVDSSGNELHLIAISSGYSGGSFHIVGWAAAAFTDVRRQGQGVELTLSFRSLLVDGRWLQPGGSGNSYDFGVRAIALTG